MIISGQIVKKTISALDVGQDHTLNMYRAPINTCRNNNICVYCGSTQHTLGNCTSQPNDNRDVLRSTPQDLHSHGPYYGANTRYLGISRGNAWDSTNPWIAPTENSGNYIPAGQQVFTNNSNVSFPYRDYRYNQNRTRCQQTSYDERYNRQYSPKYNHNYHEPSPPVSVAGPDLSTTLIDLANIQSRSLDLMVANQKKPTRCLQWPDQSQQRQNK